MRFLKRRTSERIEQYPMKRFLNFSQLVVAIQHVHGHLVAQAGKAVNISLTLRNWMIGFYIAEYELRGADRAAYGNNLLSELAKRLSQLNISNCNRRQLYRYMRFYRLYPGIVGTLTAQLKKLLPVKIAGFQKVGTMSPQLEIPPKTILLSSIMVVQKK